MFTVRAYLKTNEIYEFPARDINSARETAARIAREGLWVIHSKGHETFWPPEKLHKVKFFPKGKAPPSSMDEKEKK